MGWARRSLVVVTTLSVACLGRVETRPSKHSTLEPDCPNLEARSITTWGNPDGIDRHVQSGDRTCQRLRSLELESVEAARAGDCARSIELVAQICVLDPLFLASSQIGETDVGRCITQRDIRERCVADSSGGGTWVATAVP